MNEHLRVSSNGLELIAAFEGDPRLEARLCEGDRWELGWGCTFHLDDRPVKQGETCNLDYAMELRRNAIREFEEAVYRKTTRECTQAQFDALVSCCYNLGEGQFGKSSLLAQFNAGNPANAAADFSIYYRATQRLVPERDIGKTKYADIIGTNEQGEACWIGPDGQPTRYRRAYAGLLRRHLAEACVFLNYDWRQACGEKDAVSVIEERRWTSDSEGSLWEDTARKKTELSDLLPVASRYPLPPPRKLDLITYSPPEEIASKPAGSPVEKVQPAPQPPAPPALTDSLEPLADKPKAPPVGTKPASPNSKPLDKIPYGVDPSKGAKPMEETGRFDAALINKFSKGGLRVVSLGWLGSGGKMAASWIEKEPIFMELYLAIALLGVTTVGLLIMQSFSKWKKKRAEAEATQLMY